MIEFITPVSIFFSLFFLVPLILFLINRFTKKEVVFSHFIIKLLKRKTIFKFNILTLIIRILCILFLILSFAGIVLYRDNDGLRVDDSFVVAVNNNINLSEDISQLNSQTQKVLDLLLSKQVNDITLLYNTPFSANTDTIFAIEDYNGIYNHIPAVYREDFFKNITEFIQDNRKIIYLDDKYRAEDSENVFYKPISTSGNLNVFDTIYYSRDTLHIHTHNIENPQLSLSSVQGRNFDMLTKEVENGFFAKNLSAGWYELKENSKGISYFFLILEHDPPLVLNIYTDNIVKGELLCQFFSVLTNCVLNSADQVYFQNRGNAIYYASTFPDFSRVSSDVNITVFPTDIDSVEFFHLNNQIAPRGKFFQSEVVPEYKGFRPKFPFNIKRRYSFMQPSGFNPNWVSTNSGRALSYRKGNIDIFTFDPDTSNSSFLVNPLFIKYFEDYFKKGKEFFESKSSNKTLVALSNLTGNTTVKVAGVDYTIRYIGNSIGEIENFYFYGAFQDDIKGEQFFVNPSFSEPKKGYRQSLEYAYQLSSVNSLNRFFDFRTFKKVFLIFAIVLFALDCYFSRRRS